MATEIEANPTARVSRAGREEPSFREYLDSLKRRADLREIVSRYAEVGPKGMACCPFHEDTTPSLHVDAEKGLFHCFGCEASGDVFEFVMKVEGVAFPEAVDLVAAQVGAPLWSGGDSRGDPRAGGGRDAILDATVCFYEKALTDERAAEVQRERGVTPETLRQFRVGYGAPGLRQHLVDERGFDVEACVATGVLARSRSGTEYEPFAGHLIFPNVVRGRVVHISGRAPADAEPKWRHLIGKIEHVFNAQVLVRATEVVVVEGPFDCLAVAQIGLPCIALYGTGQIDLLPRQAAERLERVYVALDADDAGRRAAAKLATAIGFKARIVSLPDGKDPCDLVAQGEAETLRELVTSAETWVELEAARVAALPARERADGLRRLARSAASANAAEKPLIIKIACSEFRLMGKGDFRKLIEEESSRRAEAGPATAAEPVSLSDEERAEAIALLEDERLLDRVLDVLDEMGSVGEETNKLALYLAMTSRRLDEPISTRVKGESSSGKSYLVKCVARLFPEEDIVELTAMSDRALFHMKSSMEHRVLIVYERPGAQNSDYQIRTFQSEGKLRYLVTVKDPETGALGAEELEVKGPIAYIETTTEARVHAENETRCFDLHVDESEDQTRRILEREREKARGGSEDVEALALPFRNAQRLLEPFPVLIPYANLIEFPTSKLRARRDQTRCLALIEAAAFLAQRRRSTVTVGARAFIAASLEDYAVAYALAGDVLKEIARGLSPNCESMLRKAWLTGRDVAVVDLARLPSLLKRDFIDATRWAKGTVEKFLHEADRAGYVESIPGGQGKATLYRLLRLPSDVDISLLKPEELRERVEATHTDLPKGPFGWVKDLGAEELALPAQRPTEGAPDDSVQRADPGLRIPRVPSGEACAGGVNPPAANNLTRTNADLSGSCAGAKGASDD